MGTLRTPLALRADRAASPGRTARWGLLLLLLCGLAGCGSRTYEERLRRTNQRNAHYARLDAELAGYWKDPLFQIALRPPQDMIGMPPPKEPEEIEGVEATAEEPEPPPDLRYEFLGTPLDLPGLIYAGEGQLLVVGGEKGPYRLYVLGNHSRFLGDDDAGAEPGDYLDDLEIVLQNLFQVQLPPGDQGSASADNVKYVQKIPTSDQFDIPKRFTGVNFVPEEGKLPFRAWLFEFTPANSSVQFAALMLTPPNPSNEVRKRLVTSLETLMISPQPPRVVPGAKPGTVARPGGVNF